MVLFADMSNFSSMVGARIAPGNQVSVEVKNNLSTSSIYIDEEPVTGLGHTEFTGDCSGHLTDMSKNLILTRNVIESGNMLTWMIPIILW